jgi:hypothetical protein
MPFQSGNPGRPPRDPRERFWKYVAMHGSESGCWEWLGGKTWDGYGRFRVTDRTVRAHRFMWQLVFGDVTEGMELDHLCRNRICVYPGHLQEVTRLVNHRRGQNFGRRRTTPYTRPKRTAA